jgi:glycosyltransferase involved in cell wall biosynthesis
MSTRNEITFFYEFHPPPYGGGNQFLLALRKEFRHRGLTVRVNELTNETGVCLFNSYNVNFSRLVQEIGRHPECLVVHRVDGPIALYRGRDDGTDSSVFEYNARLAHVTVFQSQWSLQESAKKGFQPRNPVVIPNAVDASVFHDRGREEFSHERPIRLISTSWSDNPRKGAFLYRWLEEHLDWNRFSYTFVGRSPVRFSRIRHLGPLSSHELASTLRSHDIYLTASEKDPCSNALIEALACGLPAVYLNDGGHPDLVAGGGRPFSGPDDVLMAIDQVVAEYDVLQSQIRITSLEEVAERYLAVMGLTKTPA